MADQRAKEVRHKTVANRRRLADQERVERSDRRGDLIRRENHFNFIKMQYRLTLPPTYGVLDPYRCIQPRSVN